MKRFVAKYAFLAIENGCELTHHAFGCWVFHNRLSQAIVQWASEQFTEDEFERL